MDAVEKAVEKVYCKFEDVRKKNKSYCKKKYEHETEYKEFIKMIIENEEVLVSQFEVKAKEFGLSLSYLDVFFSIMGKKYLKFIVYDVDINEYSVVKKSNELKMFLDELHDDEVDELEQFKMEYGDVFYDYFKKLITNENHHTDTKKVKVSIRKLADFDPKFISYSELILKYYDEICNYLESIYHKVFFSLKCEVSSAKIILHDFHDTERVQLSNIDTEHIGRVVEFEADIIHASKLRAVLKRRVFICQNCGKKIEVFYKDIFSSVRDIKNCSCGGVLREDKNELENRENYAKFQEILVRSMGEDGRYYDQVVVYEDSEGVYGGPVKILGRVRTVPVSKQSTVFDFVIHALDIQVQSPELSFSQDDIEKIEKVAKHPKIIDILSNELIPDIKGYELIKKAIFLQQVKGVKKGPKRGDSHILLIADPGVGKSVMLRKIADIPGNLYGSMTTASGVGITAAVVREKTILGDNWICKPGLLVEAHGGTACIDELTTVEKDVLDHLLEVMENQTIHINKGGINAELRTECAVLAACNPRWGKFDPNVSIPEQIKIPSPLLSRFDLIFPIKDEVNPRKDEDIAKHICRTHRNYLKQEMGDKKKKNTININGVDIDDEFIIKYIAYARRKKPILSEKAESVIVDFYKNIRKSSIDITARQLEGAIRIAEAHAKAKLKDIVEEEDAEEAINIIMESLKEIAYDPETGTIDLGKITGESNKDKDKMKEIYSIIKKLSEKSGESGALVMHDDIVEEAKKKGMDEDTVDNTLEKLLKRGDIDEPRSGKYRIII